MCRKLTLLQYNSVVEILEKKIGFKYSSENRFFLESRLWRQVDCENFFIDEYIENLKINENLLLSLVEELTVHETYFFRESSAIFLFANICKKELLNLKMDKINILCAGCSTGEEPYSMLLALMENKVDLQKIEIDSFDISKKAIEFAKIGKFKGRSVKGLEKFNVNDYFLNDGSRLSISTLLRDKINFFSYNVLDIGLMKKKYDIIFCRNLLLYFTKEKKELALKLIYEKLNKNGKLFMGKTERIRDNLDFKICFENKTKYYVKQV